ncbi:MAG: hypothetical protein GY820_21860 [Gammaproteobacteria bacterium]|nr:hypothetical protein [Gammaproteobacteria bacterium]
MMAEQCTIPVIGYLLRALVNWSTVNWSIANWSIVNWSMGYFSRLSIGQWVTSSTVNFLRAPNAVERYIAGRASSNSTRWAKNSGPPWSIFLFLDFGQTDCLEI